MCCTSNLYTEVVQSCCRCWNDECRWLASTHHVQPVTAGTYFLRVSNNEAEWTSCRAHASYIYVYCNNAMKTYNTACITFACIVWSKSKPFCFFYYKFYIRQSSQSYSLHQTCVSTLLCDAETENWQNSVILRNCDQNRMSFKTKSIICLESQYQPKQMSCSVQW